MGFDPVDYLLAMQQAGKAGGGSSVTIEPLNVTENVTYTAPSGKAYSPVSVNVPNSYAAADEGKVVRNGALESQTARTITANGVYDTTANNQITVDVSGTLRRANFGGGSFAEAFSSSNCSSISDHLPELFSNPVSFCAIRATVSLGGTTVTQTIPMMVTGYSNGDLIFVAGGCNSSGVALDFIIRCSTSAGFIECQKMQYTASGTVTDLTAYATAIVSDIQYWIDLKG